MSIGSKFHATSVDASLCADFIYRMYGATFVKVLYGLAMSRAKSLQARRRIMTPRARKIPFLFGHVGPRSRATTI